MTRTLAWFLTAALALAATAHSEPGPGGPGHPLPTIDILVGNIPQPRYWQDGRWYVEALKGREYAIRLRNPYPVRVGVALSVDGLNTIDARETTAPGARKWVLAPYETVTISGWQTSSRHARHFEFTTEDRSYGQALGKTANLGIVSAAFFKERTTSYLARADTARSGASAPRPSAPAAADRDGAGKATPEEYAATGMGRRTDHPVEEVWLDLERTPAATIDVRYEFRPQLVRLGIVPPMRQDGALRRRELAHGFEPGFAPEPDASGR